jgi:two-component system cell cycle sensor histidine kinase/response regulator CckA
VSDPTTPPALGATPRGEEHYRALVDNLRQVIFQTDARGMYTFLNAAWTEITGYAVSDTLGTSFLRYVHPDDRQRHAELFQPMLTDRSAYVAVETRYLTVAGSCRWIEVFAQLALDREGRVQGMLGTLTDITERKQAEEELQTTRARVRRLLASSPAVIYSAEPAEPFAITFVSENVARQLGYDPQAMLADPGYWLGRIHPDDLGGVREGLAALARDPAWSRSQQYRVRHGNGEYRWVHDDRRLVREPGQPPEIVGSWVDVTESRRLEEERARLSSVIEQSTEATVITDAQGTVEYANPAWQRLTGYPPAELVGQSLGVLAEGRPDSEFYAVMLRALQGDTRWSGRLVSRRRDGSVYTAEAVVSPVHDAEGRVVNYVAGMHDVTHQQQIEDQLRQAQKMEIAGRLAGGIAHDFNNLLTVIGGRSHMLRARLARGSVEAKAVELIEETARRAAGLTAQLLIFSRKQVVAPRVLSLNTVVLSMENMLRRVIGEDIELVMRITDGVGRLKADPNQLEQVILNLAVNARDAMPTGGRLVLATANVEVDETLAGRQMGMYAGPYVTLTVSDTGTGIASEALPHIFEPFFTTKGERGTGLGLSTVYGIVTQGGGCIAVESSPGSGATFRVYLPRVADPALTPDSGPALDQAPRGSETILLVEDEEDVRMLASEVLAEHGYTVLQGRHGHEALEVSGRYEGRIHLLLTDVVMPQLGGRELADRLRVLRPDTRVLFTSGYPDDAVLRHRVSRADKTPLLEKPYSPDTLLRRVRELLDAPAVPERRLALGRRRA